MHRTLPLFVVLAACSGGDAPTPDPAPAPAPAPAPEPAPEPEPEPEPEGTDAPAAGDVDLTTMSEEDALAWMMTEGANVYTTGGSGGVACITCHQAEGQGVPGAFPPLAGAGEIMGDCQTHAGYVVHGLQGEIEVAGVTYNGVMPAQGNLTDNEIAAVITYERKSWGNDHSVCMPADVAAARANPPE